MHRFAALLVAGAMTVGIAVAPIANAEQLARAGDAVVGQADPPGVILAGSPDVQIEGQAAARVGDTASCTVVVLGNSTSVVSTIVVGDSTVLINGQPAARSGAPLADPRCLITGGSTTVISGSD